MCHKLQGSIQLTDETPAINLCIVGKYHMLSKSKKSANIVNKEEEKERTQNESLRNTRNLTYTTQLFEKAKAEENNNNSMEEETANVGEASNDGFRWIDEAVRLLLAEYKQHEYLLNTGKVSVKKFWEIISQKLQEQSYNITGLQCKSKFNGLRKTYKNIKDHNNKSGNNRCTWSYFELMDEMFGHKPWVKSVLTLDTSDSILPSPGPSSSNSNSSPGPRSSPCQKVNEETALEKLITIVQENKEERRKMHEDTLIRQDRLLGLLEKIANKDKQ
ncbi:probable autophagy-related protein 17 [Temnothorax curvispinosus]|uniref:Probable autophagy-related protein 17 n=1 Tax=Temnothorax curvispinosus TaxID=300111 RepID=A0A6J1PFX5_9HYME|nr:probable autophagy-related protein 17 [Temnothorax curvispinosus]